MGQPSVIVVGGGTIGLAAAWALARRGCAVTVLERHEHIHDLGSHGGYTRAIRHAYHEGESYVPLVQQADADWVELGRRRGQTLLVRTGLLEFGADNDHDYAQAIEACNIHDIEHQRMNAAEAMKRWPFQIPADWSACFTPSGGFLRVAACMNALRDEAEQYGAKLRYRTAVDEVDGESARVRLRDGTQIHADRVIVAAGAGTPALLMPSGPPLRCLRRALLWTRPPAAARDALRTLPVWGAFVPEGFFYGFPYDTEGIDGLKIAFHRSRGPSDDDAPVDPGSVDRELRSQDIEPVQRFANTYFKAANAEVVGHRVCLYTVSDSWDFVVDRWPGNDAVVVAGGFSGHGFKFAPAIGRVLADMVIDDAEGPQQFAIRPGPDD